MTNDMLPLVNDPHRIMRPVGTRLFHTNIHGVVCNGPNPMMLGIADGLWGDCTGLKGNATGKRGDLDQITPEQRAESAYLDRWTQKGAAALPQMAKAA